LKGDCPAEINVDQSPSSGLVGASPACGKGDAMLFFLKRDGSSFFPVPPRREIFLPEMPTPPDTLTGNCYNRAIAYLLFAMSDPEYGPFDAYLLGGVYDPTIIDKIRPFAASADRDVRGDALYFLAHNQVVDVIPLVRKAQEDAESQNWSLMAPLGLGDYVVPSALPLLNPLLFSTSWQVRINAETSIIRFHNPSSIPYLMVALYDPEKQNTIAYLAYCELSTYMGFHPVSLDRFYSDRAEAEMPVFSWWKLELLGKHGAQNQAEKEQRAAKPAAAPSERLFDSDLKVRRAEMTALEKRATTEDVPYLILALHDPDNSLSYRAYKTLFALLKLHSAQANEAAFAASPDVAEQPIILWWRNHFVNF
jgi:HEAT repeat protein